jgi:hypothetical protein
MMRKYIYSSIFSLYSYITLQYMRINVYNFMAHVCKILESKVFKYNCQWLSVATPHINEINVRYPLPVCTYLFPIPEVCIVDWMLIF